LTHVPLLEDVPAYSGVAGAQEGVMNEYPLGVRFFIAHDEHYMPASRPHQPCFERSRGIDFHLEFLPGESVLLIAASQSLFSPAAGNTC